MDHLIFLRLPAHCKNESAAALACGIAEDYCESLGVGAGAVSAMPYERLSEGRFFGKLTNPLKWKAAVPGFVCHQPPVSAASIKNLIGHPFLDAKITCDVCGPHLPAFRPDYGFDEPGWWMVTLTSKPYSFDIFISDINEGTRFVTENGIVFIVDKVEDGCVHSYMEGGAKGNYKDSIQDFVAFLNERSCKKRTF